MNTKGLARDLIENSKYLALATIDGNKTWTAPLYYGVDASYNFYFISRKDTLHSKNIKKNPNVSFCIYGSKSKMTSEQGLQATGKAYEVRPIEIPKAIHAIFSKKYPDPKEYAKHKITKMDVSGIVNARIYKIVPDKVYILDPKNPELDTRIQVSIR